MKSKLIDILAENLTELKKEEIAEALEVPKKADMGDYAFPCFRLAKIYRKAPNLIAQDLKEKIQTDLDNSLKVGKDYLYVDNDNVEEGQVSIFKKITTKILSKIVRFLEYLL